MQKGKLVKNNKNNWCIEGSDGICLPVNPYQQIDSYELNEIVDYEVELFFETGVEPFKAAIIIRDIDNENIELDSYHYHEIIDRLTIINDLVERQIIDHPVCYKHKDIKLMMEDIVSRLADVYLKVGAIHFNNDQEIK